MKATNNICNAKFKDFDVTEDGYFLFGTKEPMKTSDKCKAAGLKSLAKLSEITGQSTQTLRNWHKFKPELFEIVLRGAKGKD